jgi:putative transposase
MRSHSEFMLPKVSRFRRRKPYLLWRAVDEHGSELDVLLPMQRDTAAAKRFFKGVLR